MNICLKFRSPAHNEAFQQGFALQIQKKLHMYFLAFIFYVITFAAVNVSNTGQGHVASKILYTVRVVALLFVLVGTYCMRRRAKNPTKCLQRFNSFLDVLIFMVVFSYYPLVAGASLSGFGEVGVYVWQFSNGFLAAYSLSLLSNWWVRGLAIISQFAFYIVFIILRESQPVTLIGGALFTPIACIYWIYVNEKYDRLNFLEKRKVYENYEALKKIFDDVSQGIAIIDKNDYSSFYENHSVSKIFGSGTSIDWENLFSQIRVRRISPQIEIASKSGVFPITDPENSPVIILS